MADEQQQGRVWTEELKVQGDALLGKVKELAHEGNVRRIIIKDTKGKTLLEVPLTVGVVGALVAPVAAAIGAVAALAADYSIVIERKEDGTAASG
jgi:phage-related minor tail protein